MGLINRLINRIVLSLENNNIILEENKDIYFYGLEIIISNLVLLITLVLVGLLCKKLPYTFLFSIVFIGCRCVMGGYHENTRLKCFFLTHALHGIMLVLITLDCTYMINELVLIYVLFAVSVVYVAAPIENSNNPKTSKEISKNRMLSRIIVNILAAITLIGFYGSETYRVESLTVIITLTFVAVLILIPYIRGVSK